ncbi:MAG: hypothetical protein HC902_12290 [Calothrix sp. SM1_5_4]|nr:hypothetical protein [Calothrix sp. SM1_5_4]
MIGSRPGFFADEQVKGPYGKWDHTHEFEPFAGGVLLRDTVVFRLPLGWLGRLAALALVLKDVEAIFAYRSRVMGSVFCSR